MVFIRPQGSDICLNDPVLINRGIGSGSPRGLGILERFIALPTRVEARKNITAPSALLGFVPVGVVRAGEVC